MQGLIYWWLSLEVWKIISREKWGTKGDNQNVIDQSLQLGLKVARPSNYKFQASLENEQKNFWLLSEIPRDQAYCKNEGRPTASY